ncbi:hypothetical protein ACFLXU_01100 [Chloroflexota bacterium]
MVENQYEVVSPLGKSPVKIFPLAPRLDTLEGKTICEISDDDFRCEVTFPEIRKLLSEQYPGIKFVPYTELPDSGGKRFRAADSLEILPKVLAEKGCDAVISGNGG